MILFLILWVRESICQSLTLSVSADLCGSVESRDSLSEKISGIHHIAVLILAYNLYNTEIKYSQNMKKYPCNSPRALV